MVQIVPHLFVFAKLDFLYKKELSFCDHIHLIRNRVLFDKDISGTEGFNEGLFTVLVELFEGQSCEEWDFD